MIIDIPNLKELNFNGVINIGAGNGSYAKHYYELGISSVVWIEKDLKNDGPIYQNTKNFGMKQQYYFENISSSDSDTTIRFKTFWRMNSAKIDIEIYDLLHIDVKKDQYDILCGFDNFITNFKAIILTHEHNLDCKNYIEKNKYELITYTDTGHYLYLKS